MIPCLRGREDAVLYLSRLGFRSLRVARKRYTMDPVRFIGGKGVFFESTWCHTQPIVREAARSDHRTLI